MTRREQLSKVMKRAWEIKKADKRNVFAICLKMAWAELKNHKSDPLSKLGTQRIGIVSWSFNLWEKYGKKRIYIDGDGGKHGKGYIDLDHENELVVLKSFYCGDSSIESAYEWAMA